MSAINLVALESRTVPAFILGWNGAESVVYGDLNGDNFADRVVVAGQGGSARVVVNDGKTGEQLADFIAFEDTFRGGGEAVVVGDTLVIAPGVGGGGRIVTYSLDEGEVGSHRVPSSENYRGGVKLASAPNDELLAIADSRFLRMDLFGAVHQSVYIGPDWRFEPTGGYVREGSQIEATLERGAVADYRVEETMRLHLDTEVV